MGNMSWNRTTRLSCKSHAHTMRRLTSLQNKNKKFDGAVDLKTDIDLDLFT